MRACAIIVAAAVLSAACSDGRSGEIDPSGGDVVVTVDETSGGDAVVVEGEVPEGFPMPMPDGGEVADAVVTTESGRRDYHVTAHYPDDRFDELFDLYDQWMEDAGFVVAVSDPRSGFAQLAGQGNGVTASVILSDQGDVVFVSLSYAE
ncbi:MAG TPA: hypothetical protein VGC47_11185 [Acidimicrobiia bacterium]|jgi:hypothetical protein